MLTLNKQNGNLEIPISSENSRQLVTSGNVSQFARVNTATDSLEVIQEFEIQYSIIDGSTLEVSPRVTIHTGTYRASSQYNYVSIGWISWNDSYAAITSNPYYTNNVSVYIYNGHGEISYESVLTASSNSTRKYRLFV